MIEFGCTPSGPLQCSFAKVWTGRLFFPVVLSESDREGGVCRAAGRDKWGDEDPAWANGSSAPPPLAPPLLQPLLLLTPPLPSGWAERSGENSKTGRIKEHLSSHLQLVCYRTTRSISLYGLTDYLVLTGGEDNWEESQKWTTSEIASTWADSLHKVRPLLMTDSL